MASQRLARVLKAWELSRASNQLEPGASTEELDQAEVALGRALPPAAVELYRSTAGGSLVDGNLTLHPLLPSGDDSESLAVTTASVLLRHWGWPVPDEMVIFADDGAGASFGLWLPAQSGARPLVVQIGEVFEDACLAVVGDDLESFLLGWTAYDLLLGGPGTEAAVAALGVPDELRELDEDGSSDEFFARLRWADSGLPDGRPNP